jgi:hypothetical protein
LRLEIIARDLSQDAIPFTMQYSDFMDRQQDCIVDITLQQRQGFLDPFTAKIKGKGELV